MLYLNTTTIPYINNMELRALLPAIITGVVAIVGFLVQILNNIYIQRQKRNSEKTNSLNIFLLPLQKYLFDLDAQCKFTGLTIDNFILCMVGVESNANLSEHIKKKSINIYNEICSLFLKGNYCYIDEIIHKKTIKLRNHVYNTISILDSSNLTDDMIRKVIKENPLPDISDFITHINELQKKM